MAACSTLVVAGRVDETVEKEKIEKLLLIGLINSLGEEAPALDAEFGQLAAALSEPTSSGEFGLCVSNANSTATNHLIRVQFNPTAEQFRTALREAFAYALNTGRTSEGDPSVDGRVHVVYTGQVLAHTGEWLLADSALAGHQVHAWLDSQAAMAWWPQLDKYPNIGDKLHVHLVVPVAGPGSCWAFDKPGHPQAILTHVDVRLVQLNLHIEGSWRFGGKPVSNNPANTESYDGIRSFVQQTIHNHPLTILDLASKDPVLGCALSAQRPALYVFPGSGLGSQGCGLFSLQGFTMLLGGTYTAQNAPNWWSMVRNLPKLDAVLLPDWSAANLLTHYFMNKLIEDGVEGSHILGELLLPPSATSSANSESTNELALAPLTGAQPSLSQSFWASNNSATETLPPSLLLYSKLGWGELRLQPLAQRAGLVLLWKSSSHTHPSNGSLSAPLRIVLPANQLHGASPVQGLIRLVKTLSTVSSLECKTTATSKVLVGTAKSMKPSSATSRPPVNHTSPRPNGPTPSKPSAPPTRPQTAPRPISATSKTTTAAATTTSAPRKPAPAPTMNTRRPLSATTASTTAAAPKRPASGAPTNKDSATRSKPSSTTPNTSKPASNVAPTKPSPPSKMPSRSTGGTAKPTTTTATIGAKPQPSKTKPPSTADRLAAHANLVSAKQAAAKPPSMSATKTKPAVPTKKPLAPAGKPTTAAAMKAKSPIREVSEPKSPTIPRKEPQAPIKPTANDALHESMELAAVDPLMSGWRSLEHSDYVGHPVVDTQIQQPGYRAEMEDEPGHVDTGVHNVLVGDVEHHLSSMSNVPEDPEPPVQPQDLYKVHKFEPANVADEADLVDEVRTPSSLEQEPEDIVEDHIMSSMGKPEIPSYGATILQEGIMYEPESPHGHEPAQLDSVTEMLSAPNSAHAHQKDELFGNGEPNGGAVAWSRPPAHLGFEDEEEEQDQEELPSTEIHDHKAPSPVASCNAPPEFTEAGDFGQVGLVHTENELFGEHERFDPKALTPGFLDSPQEPNEPSDTGSFERNEEAAKAAASVVFAAATGLASEQESEPVSPIDQTFTMAPPMSKEINLEKETVLPDSVISDEVPKMAKHPTDIQPEAMKTDEREMWEKEEQENAVRPVHPEEDFEAPVHDNLTFITSELQSSSVTHGQPEFMSEPAHGRALIGEPFTELNQQHELDQPTHEAVTELSGAHDVKPETFEDRQITPEQLDVHVQQQHQLASHLDEEPEPECEVEEAYHFKQEQEQQYQQQQQHLPEEETVKVPETEPAFLKEESTPNLAFTPTTDHQPFVTQMESQFDEDEQLHAQLASHKTEELSTGDVDTQLHDQLIEGLQSVETESPLNPADLNVPTSSGHGSWPQVPGPQGDVLMSQTEHDVVGSDHAESEGEEKYGSGDRHSITDIQLKHEAAVEPENEFSKSPIMVNDSQNEVAIHHEEPLNAQGAPHSETMPQASPSSDVEDLVQPQSPAIIHPTAPVQLEEDEQSIEAQMRLKMQQEAGQWNTETGLYYHPGESGDLFAHDHHQLSQQAIPQQSSDVSDVEEGANELWLSNKYGVTHHSVESPVSPDAPEAPKTQLVDASEDADAEHSTQRHALQDMTLEHDVHPSTATSELDTHHRLISGSADSLEEVVESAYSAREAVSGVAADSTTATFEQAISTSTQHMDDEVITTASIVHEQEAAHDHIPDALEEHDGTHHALSTAADSTTMDGAEQSELPVSTAQVPLGFDRIMHAYEETEEHPVHLGSPGSHTSIDSVVRQELQEQHEPQQSHDDHVQTVHEGQDVHESTMHYHQQSHDHSHLEHDAHSGIDDDHPDRPDGSHDAHITSSEHISGNLSHGEAEPSHCEHPEDVAPMPASTLPTEIGFTGFEHQISKNGTEHGFVPPSFAQAGLTDVQGDKPTNGVQSSDLPGSLSPGSPGMEDYPNGSAYGFHPYPQCEKEESDPVWSPAAQLKMMQAGLMPGFEDHPESAGSPTSEAWLHKPTTQPDQLHTEETDSGARGVPYPMGGVDFLAHTTGTNPFESAMTATEFGHPPEVPMRQPSQPGHSPLISPQSDGFDPLQSWGQPQGLPTPTLPATAQRGGRTANPPVRPAPPSRTAPTSATATRGKSTSASSGPTVPSTLPPGPPVYMDLIWVPGYLMRVPQSMAVEFFARVRARTYVLSGDALHPMIGEALIEGKAKWGPNDVELLRRQAGGDDQDNAICILPTDEPYEWGCWLRTPCGRVNRDTGEARLQASGFKVLPSASCCDIEFSAGSVDVRCEGVRVGF